ncbi:MAG: WYL domain-containing protein, partial [Lachnospiraceae bacterium]|nr:WYL domain-containing protein [Lachnospiraceae bacterium]
MARAENQKLKLCYIMKILSECTSKGDGITMTELIDRLAECGVSAERKSIYSDIRAINEFGEAIRVESYRKDNETRYYADGRL